MIEAISPNYEVKAELHPQTTVESLLDRDYSTENLSITVISCFGEDSMYSNIDSWLTSKGAIYKSPSHIEYEYFQNKKAQIFESIRSGTSSTLGSEKDCSKPSGITLLKRRKPKLGGFNLQFSSKSIKKSSDPSKDSPA